MLMLDIRAEFRVYIYMHVADVRVNLYVGLI